MVSFSEGIRDIENRLCTRIDKLDSKLEDFIKSQRIEDNQQFKMIIEQNENFRADFMKLVKICLGIFGGISTIITAILITKGG